eukprot:7324543-Pyramimonas_sp.AAC.1
MIYVFEAGGRRTRVMPAPGLCAPIVAADPCIPSPSSPTFLAGCEGAGAPREGVKSAIGRFKNCQ